MKGLRNHNGIFLASGVLLALALGVFGASTFRSAPARASWSQSPPPPGFENATIYDTTLIPKDSGLVPLGIPYVGWAVGESDGGAVIFYYNGTSWSRVFADPQMAPLRAVSAAYDGTTAFVIAVGDFDTDGSNTHAGPHNTILAGYDNQFQLQVFQGDPSSPQYCSAVQGNCKSWIGSDVNPVNLFDVELTGKTEFSTYAGGDCESGVDKTAPGALIAGEGGTLFAARQCYIGGAFRMFVLQDAGGTGGFFPNLYDDLAVPIARDVTAVTRERDTFWISESGDAGTPARLFAFRPEELRFGFTEVVIGGTELGAKKVTSIAALPQPGFLGASAPWLVYMTTADSTTGAPDSGVVHIAVSGDAASGLSGGTAVRRDTAGTPVNAVAATIQYRGGNMLVNGDFENESENEPGVPEGWDSMTGYLSNFDGVARLSAAMVADPTGGPGKVLRVAQELGHTDSAAVRYYTDEAMTVDATLKPNPVTTVGPAFPGTLDFGSLISGSTTDGSTVRVWGFFEASPGSYDYKISLTNPGDKVRLFIGEDLATAGADFTVPVVDGWTSPGLSEYTGSRTFTTPGAEIPDLTTYGEAGGGIKRSNALYPFALEYAKFGAGGSVVVEWKDASAGAFQLFVQNLQMGNKQIEKRTTGLGVQQSFAEQELPQTRGKPGPAYRVSGRYRVAFAPAAFYALEDRDARKPIRSWAGPEFRCETPGNPFGDCGYNWSLIMDPKLEDDTVTDDPQGNGGWVDFDFFLAKHSGEDFAQLTVLCIAEYAAAVWCDDFSVAPVQLQSAATKPLYQFAAVGENGDIFEAKEPDDPSVPNFSKVQSVSNPLKSVSLIAPNKGIIAGSGGTFLDFVPGLVRGWGWVGTTTAAGTNDALGWISFSCADVGLCNEHQMTYGVDILEGSGDSPTVHPFAGAAWFGTTDANQSRELSGTLVSEFATCDNDNLNKCTSDADCAAIKGAGSTCPTEQRCSAFPSFSSCTVECGPAGGAGGNHPFGCSSVGWLSFERNTDPLLSAGRPPVQGPYSVAGPSLTYTATYDETTGKVEGWGRFLSLAENSAPDENNPTDGGWVKLRGPVVGNTGPFNSCRDCTADDTSITCRICTQTIDQAQCNTCGSSPSCTGRCADNSQACSNNADCVSNGGACLPAGTCSVTTTQACVEDANCPSGETCIGQEYSCTQCTECSQYGVSLDSQTGDFVGYAWSEDVGWIDFSRVRFGNAPWFQTLQGNIFTAGDVGDPTKVDTAAGFCNATYRITAVGTLDPDVCSEAQGAFPFSPFEESGAENLILPSSGLETVFGAIDVPGIIFDNDNPPDYLPDRGSATFPGRYGTIEVIDFSSPTADPFKAELAAGKVLDGRIYYYCGTSCLHDNELVLSGGQLQNAAAGSSGAGLLVVKGDLRITGDIGYERSSIGSLEQLASFGVIVLGNLTIESSVENLVGSFYVPGNPVDGSGGTVTIQGDAAAPKQFVHRGLMIAKKFEFKRRFGGPVSAPEPSERIIYDGRVVANPPPGFTTLTKALPVVRQIIP